MVDAADSEPPGASSGDPEERWVAPIEPFFDLVFVFAVNRVAGVPSGSFTWGGVARMRAARPGWIGPCSFRQKKAPFVEALEVLDHQRLRALSLPGGASDVMGTKPHTETVTPHHTFGQVLDSVIHGYQEDFPVVDESGRLVGMITREESWPRPTLPRGTGASVT